MNALPPPGWYPDAAAPGRERWWDGGQWSHVTRQPTGPNQAGPSSVGQYPTGQYPTGQYPVGPYPAPQPGYPPAAGKPLPVTPDGARLASWGRRAAARILDDLITWTVAVVVGHNQLRQLWTIIRDAMQQAIDAAEAGTRYNSFQMLDNEAYLNASLQFTLIFVLVTAIYEVPFVAMRGATPGKFALGLRIRTWDAADPPSWGASAGRWFIWGAVPALASFAGSIFWWVDHLFPLWDARRQAVHDKVAKTVVVKVR